jgi:hypothetical protein
MIEFFGLKFGRMNMLFPLDFWDISLVFAIVSFVLLLFSTLMSSYSGNVAILLDKEKLEKAAIVFLILFHDVRIQL